MIKISQIVFFSEFISLCIDSYMELLISGFLNLSDLSVLESQLLGDVISYRICILCLIFSIIILPLMILYVFSQSIEKMKSSDFEKRWGPFYDEIRTDSKTQMLFFPVYCLRRLIFVVVCLTMKEYPAL